MGIPSFSSEGTVAIITGGKSRIGEAMSLAFTEADVTVCDRVIWDSELRTVANAFAGNLAASALIHRHYKLYNDNRMFLCLPRNAGTLVSGNR